MKQSPRVSLGSVDISQIVYGMWRLGEDDTSPGHIEAKIEACLEQGVTTMDQADIYGGYQAEELLGHCLSASPGLRDRIEIVTKCDIIAPVGRYSDARVKYYDTSRAHIEASVDHSLRLMQIEHIDLLLIHRPDPLMDHEETGRALDDLISSGKIRAAGVSNFRPWDWDLLQSAMSNKLATNQIELSVLCHEAFTNGDIAHHQRLGIRPMAWSPLGGGAVFGDGHAGLKGKMSEIAGRFYTDLTSVAIAWLLHHPVGICPVMGTNRLDRIKTFWKALDIPMDRETWFEIYTAALGREVA